MGQVLAAALASAILAAGVGSACAQTVPAAPKTGKERLGDKGSDEQRVDDCKVAPERRTRARPAACPWDVSS